MNGLTGTPLDELDRIFGEFGSACHTSTSQPLPSQITSSHLPSAPTQLHSSTRFTVATPLGNGFDSGLNGFGSPLPANNSLDFLNSSFNVATHGMGIGSAVSPTMDQVNLSMARAQLQIAHQKLATEKKRVEHTGREVQRQQQMLTSRLRNFESQHTKQVREIQEEKSKLLEQRGTLKQKIMAERSKMESQKQQMLHERRLFQEQQARFREEQITALQGYRKNKHVTFDLPGDAFSMTSAPVMGDDSGARLSLILARTKEQVRTERRVLEEEREKLDKTRDEQRVKSDKLQKAQRRLKEQLEEFKKKKADLDQRGQALTERLQKADGERRDMEAKRAQLLDLKSDVGQKQNDLRQRVREAMDAQNTIDPQLKEIEKRKMELEMESFKLEKEKEHWDIIRKELDEQKKRQTGEMERLTKLRSEILEQQSAFSEAKRGYIKQEAELRASIEEKTERLRNLSSELEHKNNEMALEQRTHREKMEGEQRRLQLDMRVIEKRQQEYHATETTLSREKDDFFSLKGETLRLQREAQQRLREAEIKDANMLMQKDDLNMAKRKYEEQFKRLQDEQEQMQHMWTELRNQKDQLAEQKAMARVGGQVQASDFAEVKAERDAMRARLSNQQHQLSSFKNLEHQRDELLRELESSAPVRYTFLGSDMTIKTAHDLNEDETYKVREIDQGHDRPTSVVLAEVDDPNADTETCVSSNMGNTVLSDTDNATTDYPPDTPQTSRNTPMGVSTMGFRPMGSVDLSEKYSYNYQHRNVRNEY